MVVKSYMIQVLMIEIITLHCLPRNNLIHVVNKEKGKVGRELSVVLFQMLHTQQIKILTVNLTELLDKSSLPEVSVDLYIAT